ncbi:terminase [Xenorhabdus bovienii]|uniref:terminase n=1 Tax=Xenorhabdus bovienii TaxID=40576 RepID=UPI0023B32074|nr:terminase [Xenorhabdus bovienii]
MVSRQKKQRSVVSDPRWREMVIKYRYDWGLAAIHLFGKTPTWQQDLILEAVQECGSKTSVTSGHGTGKSDMTSIMILCFILFHPNARVIIIANKIQQVMTGIFKYLKINWNECVRRFPWLQNYFVITDTSFYAVGSKGVWTVTPKGFRLGNEEALAGEHAEYLFYIVDEASGVSDKAFGIITGALTQKDNRILLLSQPTRPSGYFYDTHHSLAKHPDNPNGLYVAITLNSEESPLVEPGFIKMKLAEYGGRDSVEYQIKVLGQFPKSVTGYLLGRDECDRAARRKVYLENGWGWVALCDVGNGRDKSIINLCKISGTRGDKRRLVNYKMIEMDGSCDPVEFGEFIHLECDPAIYPNISLVVDSDGVGSDTASVLERRGRDVQRIRWGKPMFSKYDRNRYINQRAYANVAGQRAIRSGRMRLDKSIKTSEQASKIPIKIDENGRWVIMKKEMMRAKLNIRSPDRWDTFCFGMLCDFVPAYEEVGFEEESTRSEAMRYLDDYDDES